MDMVYKTTCEACYYEGFAIEREEYYETELLTFDDAKAKLQEQLSYILNNNAATLYRSTETSFIAVMGDITWVGRVRCMIKNHK